MSKNEKEIARPDPGSALLAYKTREGYIAQSLWITTRTPDGVQIKIFDVLIPGQPVPLKNSERAKRMQNEIDKYNREIAAIKPGQKITDWMFAPDSDYKSIIIPYVSALKGKPNVAVNEYNLKPLRG